MVDRSPVGRCVRFFLFGLGYRISSHPDGINDKDRRPTNHTRQFLPKNEQDPKSWLKEGLLRRKKPDKAGRRVRNLVASQMRAGS